MSNETAILSNSPAAATAAVAAKQETSRVALVQQEAKPEQESTASAPQIDSKLVAKAMEALNQFAESQQRDLKFSVDEPSGRTVIRVYDSTSQDLIRQIPGETILQIAQRLGEGDLGALMDVVA